MLMLHCHSALLSRYIKKHDQTSLSTNQQESTNGWTSSIHQTLLSLMGTLQAMETGNRTLVGSHGKVHEGEQN